MTKNGVILLAHGSRLEEANREVLELAAIMGKKEGAGLYNDVSFLQGSNSLLKESITKAVNEGCTSIFVVPFFLTSGVHIKEDVPEMLEQSRKAFPMVNIIECRPLGCDPRLTSILWERVTEKMYNQPVPIPTKVSN